MPSQSVILTVFRLKSVIKRFATIPCFFATMIDSKNHWGYLNDSPSLRIL